MTNWIDFKELRNSLNFAEVLRHYKVELKLRGDQHHGFCPLPSHEGKRNSPSFSANIKRGIWQCFGCGRSGNTLDFAVLMEGKDPKNGEEVRKVALSLREAHSADTPKRKPAESKEDDASIVINAPLDFELKGLDPSHPYLLARGFTEETIKRFGLGFCSRGLLRDRIAIPLYDLEGKLVGYAGRVIDDKLISEENPKYRFPGRRKRKEVVHDFRKSLLVYNANRIVEKSSALVVVEGFASVWWLTQAAVSKVVGLMGASCRKEQGEIIVSLINPDENVLILTDGDSAGERCAHEIFTHVAPHRAVRWVKLKEGKQPTDLLAAELHLRLWGGRE